MVGWTIALEIYASKPLKSSAGQFEKTDSSLIYDNFIRVHGDVLNVAYLRGV